MAVSEHHLYDEYEDDKPFHTSGYIWEPVIAMAKQQAPGGKVLDAGCGNGSFAKELVKNGFDVCGIDLSESGVARANQICPEGRFRVWSVYEDLTAPFGHPFDAVVSIEVIEHLYDPRKYVEQVYSALRPGGTFILSTPYNGYLKNLAIAALGQFDKHATVLWDGGHVKFWSPKTLTYVLKEKGFEVIRFIGTGRLPYLWKSMVLVARRPPA